MIQSTPRSRPLSSLRHLVRAAATMAFLTFATGAFAQERYKTPDEAVAALIGAAKAADRPGLMRVLGPGSAEIVSSGDEVADASGRKRALDAYDAKHQVVMEGADKAALIIGNEDWPFPIPLVRKDGSWQFDTAAGRDEILFRRIGRNELSALQAALAYVDAQQEASPATASTHSALSARRERRMASIGQRSPARTRARSASLPPAPRRRGIVPGSSACRITATTSRY
jgi:Protein of unknown function (DUF2950)